MIENSEFSIVIAIPEHIITELKDPPKAILVKFKSQEEKNYYVKEEYAATKYALQDLASAWTKKERAAAHLSLYKARNAFCDKFLREELERMKNIGKMMETAGMKSATEKNDGPSAA